MKLTYRLAALSTLLVAAYGGGMVLSACSSTSDNKDGGTDGSASNDTGTKKDSGQQDTGTGSDAGGDDSGPVPTFDPLCTAPADAATNGSCVTIDGTNFACNPVNNAGCDGGAGETCDLGVDSQNNSTFQCFPPPNDVALCGTCDNNSGPFCKPTLHCVEEDGGGTGCARFCCDDTDCTGGHCDTTLLGQAPGLCVK
jgi:hypothetical protein